MKSTDYDKDFCEEFEYQIKILRECDTLVIYGQSVLSSMAIVALKEFGVKSRLRFFDRGKYIDNKSPVISKNAKACVLISAMRNNVITEIKHDCNGYFPGTKCFDLYAIYYKWIIDCCKRKCDRKLFATTLHSIREGNAFFAIDCINTTYCNLNCVECSNGIPERKEKSHIHINDMVNSLSRITKIKPICNCNIQGGEPLMYPNINSNILRIAQNPRIAFITLATNGTLLPSEETFHFLKNAGVIIRISDYAEKSKMKQQLEKKSNSLGIPCKTYARAEKWFSYGKLEPRLRSDIENQAISKKCFFGTNDMMLLGSKLFCCCRSLYVDALGRTELLGNNVIDLNDDGVSTESIVELFEGKYLYKMCDYCSYPLEEVEVAFQE